MMAGVHWLMLNMALNMIVDFDPAKHLVIRLYTHMQPQYFSSLQNMFKKNQLFWLYVIFISTVHGLRNIFVVDLRCHLLALTNQPIRYIYAIQCEPLAKENQHIFHSLTCLKQAGCKKTQETIFPTDWI